MVRPTTHEDADSICEIYNHYIHTSHCTFELDTVSVADMATRIQRVQQELKLPWLVCEIESTIVGYAYATIWKPRKAYDHTVESTVYLHPDAFGKGHATSLYTALLDKLKQLEYHAILGGIALPNDASIALHEKLGFNKVGELKQVGYKMNRWIDVGYWQLMLD